MSRVLDTMFYSEWWHLSYTEALPLYMCVIYLYFNSPFKENASLSRMSSFIQRESQETTGLSHANVCLNLFQCQFGFHL